MNREHFDQLATTLGGLCILGTLPGSPAALAGLRYGDIVLEVNGMATPDWVAYVQAINNRGAQMTVRFFRDGAEQVTTLELPPQRARVDAAELLETIAAQLAPGAFAAGPRNDAPETLN